MHRSRSSERIRWEICTSTTPNAGKTVDGHPIGSTPAECGALAALTPNVGRVMTHDQLRG